MTNNYSLQLETVQVSFNKRLDKMEWKKTSIHTITEISLKKIYIELKKKYSSFLLLLLQT